MVVTEMWFEKDAARTVYAVSEVVLLHELVLFFNKRNRFSGNAVCLQH